MDMDRLANLIQQHRDGLLAAWRAQVRLLPSARNLDTPSLNDHIPMLLEELAGALRVDIQHSIPDALLENSPVVHGLTRLQDAFDIEEIVAEYNILRGCIHDLATNHGLNLQGRPFHVINRVFDHAIGLALQTYATQSALEVQQRREEYLAFVAHDLRTPLSAITLAGNVLERTLSRQGADRATMQMLKALSRSARQLEVLVEKVLQENLNLQTESGIKLERREFDLWPLVESLIYDLQPVADTGSTTLLNQVPDDLVVYADANLLRRLLQNLIANAIKYTPHGEIQIGARIVNDAVECWVRDNGTGIPDAMLSRIFDKGEADPDGTGSGLGLTIVKTFVEAHGGRVDVESKEGEGSTFRFTLTGR